MSATPTKAIIDISKLENLADKVRAKTGTSDLMTVDDMATAIGSLPGGTDGQFFPMNMTEFMLPTMTLKYNGEDI